jgi:hypothetical protein
LKGLTAIHTTTLASYEALAAALSPYLDCVWTRDASQFPEQAAIGIWDGGQLDPVEFAALQVFAAKIQTCRGTLVVLLDFPRKEHFALLKEIGCATILGKPYIVQELMALLRSAGDPASAVPGLEMSPIR